MKDAVNFCDYFVLCSGTSDRHVNAIANGVDEGLHEHKIKVGSRQGMKESDWVVFDLGDVVFHVFQKDLRSFYRLEYLWKEAKRTPWKPPAAKSSK